MPAPSVAPPPPTATSSPATAGPVSASSNRLPICRTARPSSGPPSITEVLGNYIGTDAGGAVARPNTGAGIEANYHNFIGGEAAGAGNLISGNDGPGILVPPGEQVTIQGNRIGTIASGLIPLPNQGDGILEQGSALIGGTSDGARNIIAGNAGAGIHVKPGFSPVPHSPSVATVRGNYIGLAATGAFAVPNASFGVFLDTASFGQIGGSMAGAGNVIAGNRDDGIRITSGNISTVQGNLIGVNPLGSAAIPNAGNGISLVSTGTATIGGTAAPERNIISGNTGNGIVIDANTKQATIQGNWIGPASAAGGVLPNLGGDGIRILNNADTVGGTAAGAGNLIAGHANAGIHLTSASAADTGASSNVVQGNTIGLDAMGKPAGNKWGVLIDAGGTDQIGGATPARAMSSRATAPASACSSPIMTPSAATPSSPTPPPLPARRDWALIYWILASTRTWPAE